MTISRNHVTSAAIAFATLAASAGAALAGGEVVYANGVRQVGAAVPVPVPVPVPEVTTGWYARVDAAYAQSSVSKYKSTDPFVDTFRADSNLDNFPRYGLGIGYYFNKNLRGDVTLDQRNDVESKGRGIRDYSIANAAGGTNATIAMRDTYSDTFTSSNATVLANIYADLPVSERFTPYIGGGIGFVRHQLKGRDFSRTTTCIDTVDCNPATAGDQAGATVLNTTAATTAGGINYQFAAALMAGFSYKVWDNTKIDLGYRWLYLQGASYTGRSLTTVENLKIPDQNVHELRVGLRYDIN